MTNVLDVGQYIYDKMGQIDPWSLQKLTYYSQAWSLAWDGDPIFDEHFMAWPDGPVSSDLHRENKYYRTGLTIQKADSSSLSERQKAVIDHVLAHYGKMSRNELIEQTHREQPWIEARGGLPEDARCSDYLDRDLMRATYSIMALESPQDVPKAPQPVATDWDHVDWGVVEDEMGRWRHTFDWLAVR